MLTHTAHSHRIHYIFSCLCRAGHSTDFELVSACLRAPPCSYYLVGSQAQPSSCSAGSSIWSCACVPHSILWVKQSVSSSFRIGVGRRCASCVYMFLCHTLAFVVEPCCHGVRVLDAYMPLFFECFAACLYCRSLLDKRLRFPSSGRKYHSVAHRPK